MKKIKILALDIDGCLTGGEGAPTDLGLLGRIREINDSAESDLYVPAITLCTGRPQPYVDVLTQMIGCRTPAIFENGAGLHISDPYSVLYHPRITTDHKLRMLDFKYVIDAEMTAAGVGFVQPGKEVSLSVYPFEGHTLGEVEDGLRELIERQGENFFLDISTRCVNVMFLGIDKGSGLRWLAKHLDISVKEIASVGDAIGDIPALRASGFSACPANADPEVKSIVDFAAPEENCLGVLMIIDEIIRINKETPQE